MSEERPKDESPFFRVANRDWNEVDQALRDELNQLFSASEKLSPRELALKMSELTNRLFEALSGEERDIRQVISTLRTAHAVAWDFYDAVQATRVSVDQYMAALRQNIDSFENDLHELQKTRAA